ncbi:MAG: hypothetical protein OEZ01_14475 [Candidatus Heimdallarchaeota archaeon]|nr:hypothetical protein [Candidatus Heimdallarchaeota archaeon]MDH5647214.1 hypothetical protein [Candidatus Heimdallarchaeota archaeon]
MTTAKTQIIKAFENIIKGTEYVLQAVPADRLDFKIEENSTTLESICFHISTLPLGATLFAQQVYTEFPPVDVLIEKMKEYLGDSIEQKDYSTMFTKSCEVFLKHYNSFSDRDFVQETYSTFLTRGPVTHMEGFLSTQNHLIQHRGTLVAMLRSMGIPVGLSQYWGMKPLSS